MKFTTTTDAATHLDGYSEWLASSEDLTDEERDEIFSSFCRRVACEELTHTEVAQQFIEVFEEYAPGALDHADRQSLILSGQEADCHA